MTGWLKKRLFRGFRRYETRRHELNYLFWECTTRCNLNCLHCGSDCAKSSLHPDMPSGDFIKVLHGIRQHGHNLMVVITGGEPLLRKDLESTGREIRKLGMRWGIVSNGLLYTAKRQNTLLNAGMGALTLSLDGLESNHNWLRNHKNSFSQVSRAIALAANHPRLNFDVVTCVNQRNIEELPAMLDFLTRMNVKAWRLFTIAPIGRAIQHPELQLKPAQMKTLMAFIAATRENSKTDIKFSCEGYTGPWEYKVRDTGFFCRAGINIGSVLIDGSISACPNIDRSFVQGNIYRDDFSDIWENRFHDFRNREWARKSSCGACSDFRDCQGSGLHLWHGEQDEVLVCHAGMLKEPMTAEANPS